MIRKFKRFASIHTRLNKLTGAAVFLIPCFLAFPGADLYCFVVCALAGSAAAQELLLYLLGLRKKLDIYSGT